MTTNFEPINNAGELLERLNEAIRGPEGATPVDQERAAIYSRLSHVKPGQVQYSMEIQPDESEGFAKSRNWVVVGVYADPDRSGRNSYRPELKRLLRDIKSRKVNVVVVHRLDRIYRNLGSLLRFLEFIKLYGVRLVSVTERIDTETPWGRLVVYVLGALGEMWVRYTSERGREAKARRVSKGLPNGHLSLGYCTGLCSNCSDPNGAGYCPRFNGPDLGDGRVPVLHPIDQYAIQYMAHLYLQGYSDQDIAHIFNTTQFELPEGQIVMFRPKTRKR